MAPIDKYNSNAINKIGSGTIALVHHERYVKGDHLSVLVECTLLKHLGDPCEVNSNVLIEVHAVDKFFGKSKTSVIINQIGRTDGFEAVQNPYLSQNSAINHNMPMIYYSPGNDYSGNGYV